MEKKNEMSLSLGAYAGTTMRIHWVLPVFIKRWMDRYNTAICSPCYDPYYRL